MPDDFDSFKSFWRFDKLAEARESRVQNTSALIDCQRPFNVERIKQRGKY
jgi:hypothetical protein